MSDVFANGRAIMHKGDGLQHVAAPPDVCKTPSPAGPVPVPYVNIAQNSALASGAKQVKIEGQPVALSSSNLASSMGDEPGTAGGIISSKFKGKLTWATSSPTVFAEGKGVVRFMDVAQHNGNSFNTAFVNAGHTGIAYGDDVRCFICNKSYDDHLVKESKANKKCAKRFIFELESRVGRQRRDIATVMLLTGELRQLRERIPRLSGSRNRPAREAARARVAACQAEITAINARLAPIHVLRLDRDESKTYTLGFMLGTLRCKCGTREFVAMSGAATPGFRAAAESSGATLVPAVGLDLDNLANSLCPLPPADAQRYRDRVERVVPSPQRWECAAPKLIQACQASGHKPGQLTEMFFGPIVVSGRAQGPTVSYRRNKSPTTEKFTHRQTVPSCARCQVLLPPLMCNTKDAECP